MDAELPPLFHLALADEWLEAVERGVERTGLHAQEILRLRPDRLADPVTVLRPPLQDPEDQHVEGSLKQIGFFFSHILSYRRSSGRGDEASPSERQ